MEAAGPLVNPLGLAQRKSEGFPPPPEKDLESPSSTRLEALVPSRDSRARTRSPSPRAWILCYRQGLLLLLLSRFSHVQLCVTP